MSHESHTQHRRARQHTAGHSLLILMLRLNLIWTCCICVLGMAIAPSQDAVIAQPSFQCHTINKTSSQLSQPSELGFHIPPAPRLSLELDPTICHPTNQHLIQHSHHAAIHSFDDKKQQHCHSIDDSKQQHCHYLAPHHIPCDVCHTGNFVVCSELAEATPLFFKLLL